jgi:hypothetical protein
MSSLIDALTKVGLATRNDQLASESNEAERLRNQNSAYLTKTLEDLALRSGFDFFGKVEWLVDIYLGPEYPEQRVIEVRDFVEKYMLGGNAGKQFLQQINDLHAGKINISQLKAEWPKIWKP